MNTFHYNSSQNNDDQRKFNAERRKIEPPRKAPLTERRLTHSPYFNGPLYQRMPFALRKIRGFRGAKGDTKFSNCPYFRSICSLSNTVRPL